MTIDEFGKTDLRVGKIISAERVEGSEKLIRLQVNLGEDKPRQIVAGIGKTYEPENLIGREIIVVANLEPRKFKIRRESGEEELESNGMLLAAHDNKGNLSLLTMEKEISPGAEIS